MNDNESPDDNIIDLMALAPAGNAIVVPAGLCDAVVLGFNPDGTFYFGSECDDLGRVMLLLALAQKNALEYYDEACEQIEDDDKPPPRAA